MKRVGFEKSAKLLIGTIDGYAYKDYGIIERKDILKTVTKDIDYDIANDFLRVYNLIRTQMEKEDILIISPEELERLGEAITQLKFEIMVKSAIKIARQMDIYIFSNIVNTFPVDFYSRLRYNCIGSMSTPSRSTRPRVRKDSSKRERAC